HPVLVAGVADADAEAVEAAMPEEAHGVAEAVLAAVPAVELEPGRARRKVELVVDQQRLLRFDLPEAQRGDHRLAAEVHVGGRLQQPGLVAGDPHPRGLAEQLRIDAEPLAFARGQGVDKTEPGVVPGPCVLGSGVAQPDDEADAVHRTGAGRRPARGRRRAAPQFSSPPSCLAAGTSPPSPSASGSASTRAWRATATAGLWPSSSFTASSTPFGRTTSDRCTVSPTAIFDRSTSIDSGRSAGRHTTSTSFSSWVRTTPAVLPAGEASALARCSGTATRMASLALTRWKSRCMMICLYGWRCMSRSSTCCTLPSTSRSMIDE